MSTAVDTSGDGEIDSLCVDTLGDGVTDTIRPLRPNETIGTLLPPAVQQGAQRLLRSPLTDLASFGFTVALLATYAPAAVLSDDPRQQLVQTLEAFGSAFFAVEFAIRWAAAGLAPRYLLTPLMVIDLLNLLPALSSGFSNGPFATLRLLRTLRVLRLRRLLGRDEIDKLAALLSGDGEARVSEVQRLSLSLALSVVSICLIGAFAAWEAEQAINPSLATYWDALYFSVTTITTVGYGDVVPITQWGRAVVALEMLAAVTVVPYEIARLSNAVQDAAVSNADGEDDRRVEVACGVCGLESHEADASFCRRCGASLWSSR